MKVLLREVRAGDLPVFYEHQIDPVATHMAAFPPRDREAFMEHWNKDLGVARKTVTADGRVAGYVVAFERSGKLEIGYWLGREFWGLGIATRAVSEFLLIESRRPLHAFVAKQNPASIRVLEKCGFAIEGRRVGEPGPDGDEVEEVILKLAPAEGG